MLNRKDWSCASSNERAGAGWRPLGSAVLSASLRWSWPTLASETKGVKPVVAATAAVNCFVVEALAVTDEAALP